MAQQPAPQQSRSGLLDLLPGDAVTDHVLRRPSSDLPYTATAGTLELRGQDGKVSAKIFYTAYTAKDAPAERPVTFAFNGGPGAASAYLHLGLVGPRILDFGSEQGSTAPDGTRPALSDNPDSWLDFTDLVLIDPAGTGWSRVAGKDAEAAYHGVRADAESLAKFIALYVQKNGRSAAPKYLLGESYGGFRAAKVATALKESQGILVSGIVMLSPMIESRYIFGTGDPVGAALQLPSLAAAEMERKGAFSAEGIQEVERFAMSDYLVALAGAAPSGDDADRLYARIAEMTGIGKDAVARARGFVGDIYTKELDGAPDKIASPYDAAYLADDPYPETSEDRGADPILDGYTRAYGGAFAAYARDELKFSTEMTYRLLDKDVNRRWDWNGARSNVSATRDLRELLATIPSLRVMVVHGYSDAITPYGGSRYVLDHLPPSLTEGRVGLKLYRGGHMFYTDPGERKAFTDEVRGFYADNDRG
ncbi:carboxypeptidase [Rhizobium sp. DBTS2]|uniref:Carboxypeptidase n=2 Tax=Mycoplana rhizolycopersici TaxID=2746702 RepID=A0ABX2QG49_9HYPH|nr:carboxypeptidase [Rhizobium rhizolycopersici]NVP55321.1 carboxypeptidase [Rhizobium rhizolycopersici]